MFRALIYTILGIFVLAVIRMIMSTLTKGVSELFREEGTASNAGSGTSRPPSAGGGALKRDPVCGTFIPADSSVHKVVGGEVLYFCSTACRDKYSV